MVALRKKINGIEKIVYQEESLDIDSEKPLFLQPGRIIIRVYRGIFNSKHMSRLHTKY